MKVQLWRGLEADAPKKSTKLSTGIVNNLSKHKQALSMAMKAVLKEGKTVFIRPARHMTSSCAKLGEYIG